MEQYGTSITFKDVLKELEDDQKLRNHLFADILEKDEDGNVTNDTMREKYNDLYDISYETTRLKKSTLQDYWNFTILLSEGNHNNMNRLSTYGNIGFSICRGCFNTIQTEKQLYNIDEVLKGGNNTSKVLIVARSISNKATQIYGFNLMTQVGCIAIITPILKLGTNNISLLNNTVDFYTKHFTVIERTIQVATIVFYMYTGNYTQIITTLAIFALQTLEKHQLLSPSISKLKNHTYDFLEIGFYIGLALETSMNRTLNTLSKTLLITLYSNYILLKLDIHKLNYLAILSNFSTLLEKAFLRHIRLKPVDMFGKKIQN